GDEPAIALVQPSDERETHEHPLDRLPSGVRRLPPPPVAGLLRRYLRVVGAPGVMPLEVSEDCRLESEFLEVPNVGLVLQPKDVLLAFAEPSGAHVQLPRRHGAAASCGSSQKPDAVLLVGLVLV